VLDAVLFLRQEIRNKTIVQHLLVKKLEKPCGIRKNLQQIQNINKASAWHKKKKWLQSNPDYWKKYRKKNKEQTDRNRSLQKIRNMRIRKKQADFQAVKTIGIAKMDARKKSSN